MPSTRRLAAIFAADVAGYSRLMGLDEEGTHERLKAHLGELVDPKIGEHRGRIVKNIGDGFLAEFASVVDAVRCAVEVQREMAERNVNVLPDEQIEFRIGINLGDVIAEGEDIFGDGVNIAARLEALAQPGGICISRVVRDQVRDKLGYSFEDLGEHRVKNIARPVRVYTLPTGATSTRIRVRADATGPATPRTAPRLSIVVLPFANLSNDPEQEYFADGITDDLTTDLSRISGSFVIARNTAFTYKGKSVDVRQIGRELGVRYVLEGSVRRLGEQVRVNAQLINAETGAHVWADRFDTDRSKLVEAHDAVTGRLARTLNLQLVEDVGRQIEQERAIDPDARDLVMRGWAWFHRPVSQASRKEAQRAFQQALDLDHESVDARIGIARLLVTDLLDGWSTSFPEYTARAEQLLIEALERDANHAMAHYVLGMLRRAQGRLAESQIELETTITLDPNHADAFRQLGHTLMYLGEPAAAIPHAEKSIQLNPRDPTICFGYWILGQCHMLMGYLDNSIALLRKARTENPRIFYMHLNLAGALGLRGDIEEARAVLAEGIKLKPEITSLAKWRAHRPWDTNPKFWALSEKTVNLGLRRAGFADD